MSIGGRYSQPHFDDVTLDGSPTTPSSGVVPELASMLLFGIGRLAMAIFKRKKK